MNDIFFHPDIGAKFLDFGIEIPIAPDRALAVVQAFKSSGRQVHPISLDELPEITRQDLERAHSKDFIFKLESGGELCAREVLLAYELLNSDGSYHRYNPKAQKKDFTEFYQQVKWQVALTYKSALHALKFGFSYHLGGGMHHGKSDRGNGFCLLNDIAISILKLNAENKDLFNGNENPHFWIVDVDAHKGDGTAEIFYKHPQVSTFSIHMKDGWPFSSVDSTLDIGVNSYIEDEEYLKALSLGLDKFEMICPRPDLVFVVNGADPYIRDELESSALLRLSKESMLARDQFIYNFFKKRNIPQTYVMAGGYGPHSWEIYYQFLVFVGQHSS